jgi:hypothetical protein
VNQVLLCKWNVGRIRTGDPAFGHNSYCGEGWASPAPPPRGLPRDIPGQSQMMHVPVPLRTAPGCRAIGLHCRRDATLPLTRKMIVDFGRHIEEFRRAEEMMVSRASIRRRADDSADEDLASAAACGVWSRHRSGTGYKGSAFLGDKGSQ